MKQHTRTQIDVESFLHWVYQDQQADEVTNRAEQLIKPSSARSHMGRIERHGVLGTQIDCIGSWTFDPCNIHPDADVAHDAVRCLDPNIIGLVIHHAKTGTRPDPMLVRPTWQPTHVEKRNKRPFITYVQLEPALHHIQFHRKRYTEWCAALEDLRQTIGPRMMDYRPTRLNCDLEPWQDLINS